MKTKWAKLSTSIVFAEFVGILSGLLAGDIKTKYAQYVKPVLSPPDWLFGVMWPILYALMGWASYLIYVNSSQKETRRKALCLYGIQLFLNFIWSIVFFRFDLLWGAFAIIVALDILVFCTIKEFKKLNDSAAFLMVPYLVWILFATYLNAGVAFFN